MNRSRFHLRRLPLIAVLLVVISIAIASCTGNSPADAALQRAELLIDSVPAEGMAALDSIPADRLTTPRSRALYDLLHTRAAHRLHLNPAADSAMDASVSYFEQAGSGEAHHLKMACFYSAVAHYYAGNYPAALRRALRCIDIASDRSDNYYLAKAHELIADINTYYFQTDAAMNEDIIAASYYKKAGYKLNELWAHTDRAYGLKTLLRYDDAIQLIDSIERNQYTDSVLFSCLQGLKAYCHIASGNLESAQHIMNQVAASGYHSDPATEYRTNALIYLRNGNISKAKEYLDSANSYLFPGHNINILLLEMDIHKANMDYESAFKALRNRYEADDSILRTIVNSSISHVNEEFIADKNNYLRHKLQSNQRLLLTIVISGIVVGLLSIYLLRLQRIKRRYEREQLLSVLYENQNLLNYKDEHIKVLSEKEELVRGRLQKSFRMQFAHLDKLCREYSIRECNEDANDQFIRQVETIIKRTSSKETRKQLKTSIDEVFNGLASRMGDQLPKISSENLDMLFYIISGFSTKSICLFMGITVGNFYMKRRRLIKMISESSAKDKQEFLSYLNNAVD